MEAAGTTTLNNKVAMPRIGLGTWNLTGAEAESAVLAAIELGYRSFDTAAQYANESAIGRGIHRSGLPREDFFITTKLPNASHSYENALNAFSSSARRLGVEWIDLYLIHWPVPKRGLYPEAWRALERLYASGRVRAIGVSNFTVGALNKLLNSFDVVPAVNQIELHPLFQQQNMRDFHSRHGIVTEAWSPLAKGLELLHDVTLEGIGRKHGRTTAQVILRWHLHLGNIAIPKSARPARLRENLDIYGFELDDSDMIALQALDRGRRLGEDPEIVD